MIVRESPLPVGRYWLDLVGPEAGLRFTGYVRVMGESRIRVVTTNHHPEHDGAPPREWVLFEVLTPVVYDHSYLPSPNDGKGINNEEDTISKPPDPTISDYLPSLPTFSPSTPLVVGLGIGFGLAVAALVYVAVRK